MFKKRGTASNKVDTVIGKETEIKGTLKASGLIRVDGKFEGDIQTQGDIIIGESAEVQAEIKASNLTLAGRLKGNAEIINKLEIYSKGRLTGDIKVNTLVMAEGAIFEGNSNMSAGKQNKKIESKESLTDYKN